VLAWLILLLSACASGDAGRPLRVLVFNIHAGRDAAGVDNLERVAALINSIDADLVLLQEVDRGTARSDKVDQLEVLMRLTKRHGAFGKSLDYQGGDYGIATLSRWPITAQQTIPLHVDPPQARAGGSTEPRVALVVDTNRLRIVNTHLDASRQEEYRLQEIERLLPEIERQKALLAGGDFNAEPESTVHRQLLASGLRDAWLECGEGPSLTFSASAPVKRIDYLFLLANARCTSARVLESSASDHRPVVIDVMRR
jgi:endonuclease/exonuclease/phosphatase family metal-dependent hydrolase